MTDAGRVVVWLRETMDAAEQRAEAAAKETGSADWEYQERGSLVATSPPGFEVAAVDYFDPAPGKFMAENDPAAVLRRIARDRKLLDWGNWPGGGPDSRDAYEWAVRLLAEGYGWKEDQ